MKTRIAKSFTFDSAHWLPEVPRGHKCGNMHGHTYRVEVICEGPLVAGMVVDYEAIAIVWDSWGRLLDHRVLNEVPGLENPTTEVLAAWLLEKLTASSGGALPIVAIRVYESASTWCEASP